VCGLFRGELVETQWSVIPVDVALPAVGCGCHVQVLPAGAVICGLSLGGLPVRVVGGLVVRGCKRRSAEEVVRPRFADQ